jgi:chaperonin GroEL
MVLEYGLLSPQLLKKEDIKKQFSEMKNVKVLILKDKLIHAQDASSILNSFHTIAKKHYKENKEKISLLIIAKEYSESVLDLMASTKRSDKYFEFIGDFQAILSPGGTNTDSEQILGDIESVTLGTMTLTEPLVKNGIDNFEKLLGHLDEVAVRIEATILKGLNNEKVRKSVEDRIELLKELLGNKDITKSKMKEDEIRKRISKLSGGVAVLRIFGATEIEYQDLMEKTDDALRTVRTAQEGGIIPGGGNTLKSAYYYFKENLNLDDEIENLEDIEKINKSFLYGKKVLLEVLIKPFMQICENAGIETPFEFFNNFDEYQSYQYGIDVSNWEVVDLIDRGIIDATNSIVYALKHAVTNTIMTIRTNGSILNSQNKQ